ncbi:alpha/beta hydrolase [filamentous cyanobacterium LEGE 11480]|uniref:Alpha/beta hydrolase n=1 Tax=Romeriopsis navalis LEGE 11480 TaxID=2777977 RepID=A0A928VVD1_9CYAN|nr:alpha/beta hydrolase [Romeriopsis navalis]MBE9032909.1 alpha/beta hydrolase [Romeriopsis navalis LEGE 11480]
MKDQPIVTPDLPVAVEAKSPEGPAAAFGGAVKTYHWNSQGTTMRVVYEVIGQGQPVLLLPAFSSVCSRTEMGGLAQELAASYQVYVLDWIGFGDSDRPKLDYVPKVYRALLRTFVNEVVGEPPIVVAAGHTAGYVMQLAQETPQPWKWIVLVAPTWRGPLPTMMGEQKRNVFKWLQKLVDTPVIGQFLYWLNTTQGFLRWMYGRHVFANSENIVPELVQMKQELTRRKNGRFPAVAFVTGALDPLRSRDDWMSLFQPIPVPVLMVIGEHMPPKSRQEAEVVAHFGGGVQVVRMPGSLGLHEEYPEMLAERILVSLDKFFGR